MESSYFDSLMPHGDNQDYVERLQQDIRELREEYAAARRRREREDQLVRSRQESWREECAERNREQELDVIRTRDMKNIKIMRDSAVNNNNNKVQTLVRRSFWEDLANMKVKISKKSSSSSKSREEESETRDSWYRTSRRYSDSRTRRSIRRKPVRERTSHKEAGRKKVSKSQTKPSTHHLDRGSSATKKVYDEILDIVNVNSPDSLPFGRDRMAQWLLSSRTIQSDL